jgi:hypothetical protein
MIQLCVNCDPIEGVADCGVSEAGVHNCLLFFSPEKEA